MKRFFVYVLVMASIFSYLPKGFALTADEEIQALKQQVQELMKRIEQLEQEQVKFKEAAKKEGEKPLLTKLAEAIQPGYAKEGQIKLKGYLQARYEWYQLDSTTDTFKLKSAYIIPYGTIVPGWDFEVEIDAADTTGKPMRNAFIEYTAFKPYAAIRVGQQKPSYSEEFLTSSSVIDTIERALPVTNLSAERDIGINVFGKLLKDRVDYGIGIFNGNGTNTTDDNDGKDVAGRLVFSPFKGSKGILGGFTTGGAFWLGKQPQTTFPTGSTSVVGDRDRFAGLLAYKYGRMKLQSEYLYQAFDKTAGGEKKSNGWYLLGTYDLIKQKDYSPLQLVAKYEQYDPDKDVSRNRLDIATLGVNYFFNKYTKIMANYRFRDEQTKVGNDEFLTQLQVKF